VFARLPARCFLAAFLAVSLAVTAAAQPASSVFQQVDEMVTALSEITGWKVNRKVPAKMLGKDTFRRYVETRMKETSSKEQQRAEELTLKMFGFIPQDFNLAKETVDLVSEQAAAFYDYNKKRLFILDSTAEGAEQRVALVHELAHALADQHHPLGKYLHKGSPDDDEATARQAVMEGQATWLTWAYVSKRNGGKPEVPQAMLDQLTKSSGADGNEFPVFTKAPLYLRESLVFPYNEGLRFQDAVYRKIGRAGFDSVFDRAPLSTQQIMHPDLYFGNRKPDDVKLPTPQTVFGKQSRAFRTLAEGSLGELDHSLLLRQYVDEKEAVEAAGHWKGGAFRLYESKRDKHPVLNFVSTWDSKEGAQRFFELYQRVMKKKWKKYSTDARTMASTISGAGDSGKFQLTISEGPGGWWVDSREGLR
jgi:hypothetical protein